jgi:hypothetical protein
MRRVPFYRLPGISSPGLSIPERRKYTLKLE